MISLKGMRNVVEYCCYIKGVSIGTWQNIKSKKIKLKCILKRWSSVMKTVHYS